MSNSPSRSRGAFASGFCDFASLTPSRGVGGAPRNVRVQRHPSGVPSARHKTRVNALMTRHARRLARRLASHAAGRSPLGAPPWRFWAPAPRFSHRHVRRIGYSELLAPRSWCLEGGVPRLPGRAVTSRRRRTPRLAPHSGSSLEHALNERGWEWFYHRFEL